MLIFLQCLAAAAAWKIMSNYDWTLEIDGETWADS